MSMPLSPAQIQQLAAMVASSIGPQSVGEGFPNPVAQLFQAGNTVLINTAGFFVYAGTPAAGNLLLAIAPAAGTDQFGNAYGAILWVQATVTVTGNGIFIYG